MISVTHYDGRRLRCLRAYAGLDYAKQALVRTATQLRLLYRPAFNPMVTEILTLSERLTILGRLVNAAFQEERKK